MSFQVQSPLTCSSLFPADACSSTHSPALLCRFTFIFTASICIFYYCTTMFVIALCVPCLVSSSVPDSVLCCLHLTLCFIVVFVWTCFPTVSLKLPPNTSSGITSQACQFCICRMCWLTNNWPRTVRFHTLPPADVILTDRESDTQDTVGL